MYHCKVKEIGNSQQSENEPDEAWHGKALLIVKKTRMRKSQDSALCFQFAATLREDITHPLRLGSIGERYNEFFVTPEDKHWRPVPTMCFTPNMQH